MQDDWKRSKKSKAVPLDVRYSKPSKRYKSKIGKVVKGLATKLLNDWKNDRLVWSKSYVHEMSESYINNAINYIDDQDKPDLKARMMKHLFLKELNKRISK